MSDDDDDMGPGGTLVMDPEKNPANPARVPARDEEPDPSGWDDDEPATKLANVERQGSAPHAVVPMALPPPPPAVPVTTAAAFAATVPPGGMPAVPASPTAWAKGQPLGGPTMQIDVPPSVDVPAVPADARMPSQPSDARPLAPAATLQMDLPVGGTIQMSAQPDRPAEAEPAILRIVSSPDASWGQSGAAPMPIASPPAPAPAPANTRPSMATTHFVPIAAAIIAAGVVASIGFWLLIRANAARPAAGSSSAVATAMAMPPTAEASAKAPADESAAPALPAEDEKAKAALERFRSGIQTCIRDTIKGLPGTSPPVPDGFAWLKKGPYASLKRDWASAVFHCSHFTMEEPMPFVIQWQAEEKAHRGTGIVWVDRNGDGAPDSAYAFVLTLEGKNDPSAGPIESTDPSRKLARGR